MFDNNFIRCVEAVYSIVLGRWYFLQRPFPRWKVNHKNSLNEDAGLWPAIFILSKWKSFTVKVSHLPIEPQNPGLRNFSTSNDLQCTIFSIILRIKYFSKICNLNYILFSTLCVHAGLWGSGLRITCNFYRNLVSVYQKWFIVRSKCIITFYNSSVQIYDCSIRTRWLTLACLIWFLLVLFIFT